MRGYNHSYHRSIKTTPALVTIKNEEMVWDTLYDSDSTRSVKSKGPLFKYDIGEQVRISMSTRPFRKGYLPKWTEEIFEISDRVGRVPVVYKIKDFDGEEIEGTFYEEELQRVHKKISFTELNASSKSKDATGKHATLSNGSATLTSSQAGSITLVNYKDPCT
jgi:hypothetical protein